MGYLFGWIQILHLWRQTVLKTVVRVYFNYGLVKQLVPPNSKGDDVYQYMYIHIYIYIYDIYIYIIYIYIYIYYNYIICIRIFRYSDMCINMYIYI